MPSPLLEAYEVERSDFQRVLDGIESIKRASHDQLQSLPWLLQVIRGVGVVPIPEAEITYEGEEDWLNASQQGLIQLPREFAKYLLVLAVHRPETYLEIGCFNGAAACLATAYLHRFNPELKAVTVDVWPTFVFHHLVADLIPLEYVVNRTSYDFRGRAFDAVFIDGDHSFDWAWADYQNVGRQAKICAFHDVNNAPYRDMPMGGVCGVWELLKVEKQPGSSVETVEIFEHPSRAIMGIGVRLQRKD